jgi:dihydrofolate reductase
MAKLIYFAFTSLDGYVADETGNFDWAELDEEVHAFINSRERQIGTYLFGRKMYFRRKFGPFICTTMGSR